MQVDIAEVPNEKIEITPKIEKQISYVSTHEAGHALATLLLGEEVSDIDISISKEGKGAGLCGYTTNSVSQEEEALISCAGFAAEYLTFGEAVLEDSGSTGGDTRILRDLGYGTQEKMAKVLLKTFDLLNPEKERLEKLSSFLQVSCVRS